MPSTYIVRNGDTLQSIARNVWGDAAMWYLLADANGLASNSAIVAGQVLTIPNKVTNIHNNAGTFKPYNPGEAIGDTSPTLPVAPNPPVKKKKCGGLFSIFVAVIAVVATIYTAGAFAAVAGAGAAGGTFATGVAVLGGTATGLSAGAAFGIAAVAGAVGSIAGQVAGLALGVQDKFSWGAVAAGAIGAGIGAAGAISISSGVPGQIASAVAGNIVNQGVGIITGAQKGFSWAGVAAAAIAAPITSGIGKTIKDSNFGGAGTAGYAIRGAAIGIATSTVNELTRVAIVGGKVNWSSVAIGGIQGGIYGYGEGLNSQARINALSADKQAKQAEAATLQDNLKRWNKVGGTVFVTDADKTYIASTGGGIAMDKYNEELNLFGEKVKNKLFGSGYLTDIQNANFEQYVQTGKELFGTKFLAELQRNGELNSGISGFAIDLGTGLLEARLAKEAAESARILTGSALTGFSREPGMLRALEVGTYQELGSVRKLFGSEAKFDLDHIPSKAALKLAKEDEQGFRLSASQLRQIDQEGVTVAIPKEMHQLSRTYAGKNNSLKVLDSANLHEAIKKDLTVFINNAKNAGISDYKVMETVTKVLMQSREKGLIK